MFVFILFEYFCFIYRCFALFILNKKLAYLSVFFISTMHFYFGVT